MWHIGLEYICVTSLTILVSLHSALTCWPKLSGAKGLGSS